MKRTVIFALICIILTFAVPMAVGAGRENNPIPPATETATPSPPQVQPDSPVTDNDMLLTVFTENGTAQMTMGEYLPYAVAGEAPAYFEPEALKAQAVALRTYALYGASHRRQNHPDADICVSSACCAAMVTQEQLRERWGDNFDMYFEKICNAVSETDGQYLTWEDEPILAAFHSCSYGVTETGANVWGPSPYLISVDTPETENEVKNLVTTVEVSAQEFSSQVLRIYAEANFSGDVSTWVGERQLDDAGRVSTIGVGGVSASGNAMRNMFSLRSVDFDLKWNGENFIFTVRGYGHGVGMSQYGANVMAKRGANYAGILQHYYPGTELVVAVKGT